MFSVLLTVTSPSASFKVSQEQKSWSQASCLTTRELPPAHSLAHSEARCCFHIFHVYIYIFTVALYLIKIQYQHETINTICACGLHTYNYVCCSSQTLEWQRLPDWQAERMLRTETNQNLMNSFTAGFGVIVWSSKHTLLCPILALGKFDFLQCLQIHKCARLPKYHFQFQ